MGILTNRANFQDIDGILWGWQWAPNQVDGHTQLSYSFPTSAADYGYTVTGFEAFNAAQQAAATKVISNYDAVCNVDFVLAADGASGNVRFAEADSFSFGNFTWNSTSPPAFGLAPDDAHTILAAQGDTWFNHDYYNTPTLGNFSYAYGLMHEVGHALGLKHGQDSQDVYDGLGNFLYTNPALPAAHDSVEYSIMTYRGYVGGPLEVPDEGPSTLMQDDIYALQWMYGANYDHNAGNTVYKWNDVTGEMSVNGARQGVPFHHKIFMTIWDGGGNDTYDFSNFDTRVTVDLRPGGWSTPDRAKLADLDWRDTVTHPAIGSIANALAFAGDFRGYIENAKGGTSNDVLIGNALNNALYGNRGLDALIGLDGNDKLVGGLGADAMLGGAGRDIFDFNAVSESGKTAKTRDIVADFEHKSDRFDFSTIDANGTGAGNTAFRLLTHEGAAFTGIKGQLRWDQVNLAGTANDKTIIEGDVNGDQHADFQIELTGLKLLTGVDFIL